MAQIVLNTVKAHSEGRPGDSALLLACMLGVLLLFYIQNNIMLSVTQPMHLQLEQQHAPQLHDGSTATQLLTGQTHANAASS
jgi:hypothetical protein